MSGYFAENKKIISLTGVLGRRDFFVNVLFISMIKYLLVTPVIYSMFIHPELISVENNSRPLWALLYMCVVGLIVGVLYFPSLVRRVRDILGEENDNRIYMISAILSLIIFIIYTPVGAIFGWLGVFAIFMAMFLNGKITGEKPKSEIVKFNWGAFFGTWIWGIFNRAPVTLWILPLMITPAWLPFMFICGMKGNEWAYNNNKEKYEDIEKFHLTQSVQSIFLTILSPVIFLICFAAISISTGLGLYTYSQKHPEFVTKMETKLGQYQVRAVESTFDKVELEDGVYKFYLNPENWNAASNTLKMSVLKNAQSYVLIKNNRKYLKAADLLESVDLINSVKVYSTFNNEILAEFNLSQEAVQQLKTKLEEKLKSEFNEIWNSGYKLNTRPATP